MKSTTGKGLAAVSHYTETELPDGRVRIRGWGRVGDPALESGLKNKYPLPQDIGLPDMDRWHLVSPDATGAEDGIAYAPRNFNLGKTKTVENAVRRARIAVREQGGEVYYDFTADCRVLGEHQGVRILVVEKVSWDVDARPAGSDKVVAVVHATESATAKTAPVAIGTTPVKPPTGTPAKPTTGTPAKPTTGTPAKPTTGTPAKPTTGTPAKPTTGTSVKSTTGKGLAAVSHYTETELPDGRVRIRGWGRVGDPALESGLKNKYPLPQDIGLPDMDRWHLVSPDATGAEDGIAYAPRNFNLGKTKTVENAVRRARIAVREQGGEVYYDFTADCRVLGEHQGVRILVVEKVSWDVDARPAGSDKVVAVVHATESATAKTAPVAIGTTPVKPPTGTPAKPTTDAPAKPTTGTPAKPTTGAPAKPTTGTPAKPTTGTAVEPPSRSTTSPVTGAGVEPTTEPHARPTTSPATPATETGHVGEVKPPVVSGAKTGVTPEVDVEGAAPGSRISTGLALFNLVLLLGRLLPDPEEAERINKALTKELQRAMWQARLKELQPVIAQTRGSIYYLIWFKIHYEAHQSPKPQAFGNSYSLTGVEVLGIDLTLYPVEVDGDLDYPNKPDWAHRIWGGGYYWEASKKCAISSPAKTADSSK